MPRDCGIHRQFVKGAAPGPELVQQLWEVVRSGAEYLVADALGLSVRSEIRRRSGKK